MSKISTLKPGDSVESFYLVKRAQDGVTQQGKPYMTLILADKTGELDSKLWTVTPEQITELKEADLVKVRGEIINYRGKNQMKILEIRTSTPEDNVLVKDFLKEAPIDGEDLFEKIFDYALKITNANLQRITRGLLNKYRKEFSTFPAAMSNHHDFVSGLAYHVYTMLRVGESLCDIYETLDRNLLYAGIILHDIGKVKELSGAVNTTYTVEGNLIGHIVIATEEITKIAEELNIEGEDVMLLKHLILAHHGKLEYGSPKTPMIPEAEILHMIDNIDARVLMMNKHIQNAEKGAFTQRVFPLEGRMLYRSQGEE
ncbi:3'-5' exoribonuclease YhaM [Nosocomiicoccus ampullae]|uniref:3'-5' exoribonuclease n=1 Tax=Nosocomiicoccus ampullae TaxID=489910 RepID=A0A9Q2CYC8_9STAP|nr:3'-5' exoribonuclease YhaM [Nosocomiicoccus ampullae]MBB5175157.1 3'-5' exoribonuclease [Nosocomiicoccus ampullae]QYA46463.1 3'-5' exoribonuclease YhaM [Nosocomiicoccus ampullae]